MLRSFILVPIDFSYASFYRLRKVTFALGRTVWPQYITSQTTTADGRNKVHCKIALAYARHHHHHIYSPTITPPKITKIGGLPETGYPSNKINCPQIISYNKQKTNKKQQHCAGAIGHEQYHHFTYNNHNSYR